MTNKAEMHVPQNPVILRCHRIMESFAKSDDERDFYLDRLEGFLIYVDLDKSQEEIDELVIELASKKDRYISVPKLTFYEVKKLMEGFVNEKVYDIDTKEKLLDIIQSKEARENFLEFMYDHHSELEKWQQYYQERFRVKIIEWLRNNTFDFVFEEDIELTKSIVERIKINMFTVKVSKDILQARKILSSKAATYYSNEALNPRPKRGRPPKQIIKVETEPQFSQDIYIAVPKGMKPFLFTPDYHSSSMIFTFSCKFTSEADLLAHRRQQLQSNMEFTTVGQKLAVLKTLSSGHKTDILDSSHSGTGDFNPGQINRQDNKDVKADSPHLSRKTHIDKNISVASDGHSASSSRLKKSTSSKKKSSILPKSSSPAMQKKTSVLSSKQMKDKDKKGLRTAKISGSTVSSKKLGRFSTEHEEGEKKQKNSPATKKQVKKTTVTKKETLETASSKKGVGKQKIRLRPLIRKIRKSP